MIEHNKFGEKTKDFWSFNKKSFNKGEKIYKICLKISSLIYWISFIILHVGVIKIYGIRAFILSGEVIQTHGISAFGRFFFRWLVDYLMYWLILSLFFWVIFRIIVFVNKSLK